MCHKHIQIDILGLGKEINELSKRNRFIHGVSIFQHDEIIFEKIYNDYNNNELHPIYSCTKSVLSTLIGIALDKGFLPSTEILVYKCLKGYEQHLNGEKRDITLKHLLSMKSGLEWDELNGFSRNDGLWNEFLNSIDPAAYVVDKALIEKPGRVFNYNSGISHLLSIIIQKNTGVTTREFAQRYLFDPLEISEDNINWSEDNNGVVYGGHGLEMKIDDLLKIGILYLNEGNYDGRQIVTKQWIREVTSIHSRHTRGYAGYGYQWWRGKIGEFHFYGAFGHSGQRIYVFEELNLVVTFLGNVQPEFGIQERLIKKFMIS